MSLDVTRYFTEIRHLGRSSIERSLRHVPLSLLLRVSRSAPLVVFYHVVTDGLPHITPLYRHLTIHEFERQIDFLLRRFVPVDLEAILHWLDGGPSLPANAIFFTFDDGLREVAEVVAPILKRKGVTAAIFVNSAFIDNRDLFYRFKAALMISRLSTTSQAVINHASRRLANCGFHGHDVTESIKMVTFKSKRVLDELGEIFSVDFAEYLRRARPYMDSEQIGKLIDDGFDIGGHSREHTRYSELNLAEQLEETHKDMTALCARFALRHRIFAFPFGCEGVSDEFYDAIRRKAIVEATFGTGGWYHDRRRGLINRLWLEGLPRLTTEDLQRSIGLAMITHFVSPGGAK